MHQWIDIDFFKGESGFELPLHRILNIENKQIRDVYSVAVWNVCSFTTLLTCTLLPSLQLHFIVIYQYTDIVGEVN